MARELGAITLASESLWQAFPLAPHHPGKRTLFEAAGGKARIPRGPISISRWAPSEIGPLGPIVPLRAVSGPFAYADSPEPEVADTWHVNFADDHLFAFWGGQAFGQDEIQVAEHPVLASVRLHLVALADPRLLPLTRAEDTATPVLIRGAARFSRIDTEPPLAEPYGIYGRAFARASEAALRQAVTRLPEGTRTNVIAMAAPRGTGAYSEKQIADVLSTAITGFDAAKRQSPAGLRTRVWTGHWGTGAFGGDRLLNAVAQLLAARIVGLSELVFCSIDDDGEETVRRASTLAATFAEGTPIGAIVDRLHAARFVWGSPDGN